MNKELKKIISNLQGNVLGIGLDDTLIESIMNNNEIKECNLLDSIRKGHFGKGKGKSIRIKKIRATFKKKKVDYIICNYETISKYLDNFVKDSVYINKGKLYFFGKMDIELLKKRYSRYQTDISEKKYRDNSILMIDNSNAFNSFLKDTYYRLIDFKDKLVEIIGDLLMN